MKVGRFELIRKVPPKADLPDEGFVRLRAIIRTDGRVTVDKRAVEGPRSLHEKAREAVEQWRYQAGELGGQPDERVLIVCVPFGPTSCPPESSQQNR